MSQKDVYQDEIQSKILDYLDQEEEDRLIDYDITATPNDFNISTIVDFINKKQLVLPEFQRNYVWDIRKASKLIESLILGLPVPQIFLFQEKDKKYFTIIDGHQRLMSIYYFYKQRFPKKERVYELRKLYSTSRIIPDNYLYNNDYFSEFKLTFTNSEGQNPLTGLNYSTLEEFQFKLDTRTLRTVILKQNKPENDDSSIIEIFYRLNTGGMNLNHQEIRMSLHLSEFYKILFKLNELPKWREILNISSPDPRFRDFEIILRGFAILIGHENYKPSMTRFLDNFSKATVSFDTEYIEYLEKLFKSFVDSCSELPNDAFLHSKKRFYLALFEAVFFAVCFSAYANKGLVNGKIEKESLQKLKDNTDFNKASLEGSAQVGKLKRRLELASEIIRMR